MSVDSRVPSCGNIFSSPFPIFSWSFKSDHVSHKYGVCSARRPDGASSVPKLERTGNCFDRTPKANGRMKMHALPNSKERRAPEKWIPLLEKEGWPCDQEKNPFRIGTAGGVAHKSRSSIRFET